MILHQWIWWGFAGVSGADLVLDTVLDTAAGRPAGRIGAAGAGWGGGVAGARACAGTNGFGRENFYSQMSLRRRLQDAFCVFGHLSIFYRGKTRSGCPVRRAVLNFLFGKNLGSGKNAGSGGGGWPVFIGVRWPAALSCFCREKTEGLCG